MISKKNLEISRRDFIQKTILCTAYGAFRAGAPFTLQAGMAIPSEEDMSKKGGLLRAMESSNVEEVAVSLGEELRNPNDALKIHQKIFSIVQRVLNPPFMIPMRRLISILNIWIQREPLMINIFKTCVSYIGINTGIIDSMPLSPLMIMPSISCLHIIRSCFPKPPLFFAG